MKIITITITMISIIIIIVAWWLHETNYCQEVELIGCHGGIKRICAQPTVFIFAYILFLLHQSNSDRYEKKIRNLSSNHPKLGIHHARLHDSLHDGKNGRL